MIHLHCHSHYSVLDGLGQVPEIVKRAKAIGAPAVAITDHASISAMPELFKECKEAGIKPIIGVEFYVVDKAEPDKDEKRYHLTVLAKTWAGVQSLMRQLSVANRQFYKRPRITWPQVIDFEDCIIMSACSSGLLAHDRYQDICWYQKEAFGADFYLEVMPHNVDYGDGADQMEKVNKRAIEMAEKHRIKLVATNDAHYINKDDSYTHEILLAIQSNKTWDDPKRWRWNTDTLYMRSAKEMLEAFNVYAPYVPAKLAQQSIINTVEIAKKCNVEMPKFEVHLPSIYENDDKAFMDLILAGWGRLELKIPFDKKATYGNRLTYEIKTVKKLGFIRYFLMVEDIIRWARDRGIMVGPARGSAAGSLICYLMGITQIDPIKHGLYFERFLNPERIDLPDIDVDFQDDRRDEVFKYINEKYGADKTANINTFGKLTITTAFRDVARTFGINPLQINLLSKKIEDEDSFASVPELVKFAKKKEHQNIIEQAKKLRGTIRQQGVHACGYIVSSEPLDSVSVIERRKGEVDVVNWDMRDCEKFGLLKVDVLGLSTLTILNYARKMAEERHGVKIDFTEIPLDNKETLASFSRGEGIGVFQFEGAGMQQLLRDLKASDFETVTDTTALYRPGSLESGETKKYVQVAKGHAYEEYVAEQMRPILRPTKGLMVYQEQIMQIFNQLAGFSWAEADKMRKIIGKKLGKDEFNKHRKKFMDGCVKNKIDAAIATEIFDKMVEFAAYSFNKSHAVAYTTISYWCMYMKVHYTLEFLTAHLSYCKESNYPILVKEANRLGVKVRKPDINVSVDRFTIGDEPNTILSPLGVIKGVGKKAVDALLEARKDGAFLSLEDLEERVEKRLVNTKIRKLLIQAGALENLGHREPSREKREKDYADLLPIFNKLPSLTKEAPKVDQELIEHLYMEISECCAERSGSKQLMAAKSGTKPAVMVINNPVKGEQEHLANKGTKHFLSMVKTLGFTPRDFYYTSPVKCFHKVAKDVTKECEGRCKDFLRREIEIVAPKLIICFATNVLDMFVSDKKPSMSKLHGEVIYNREFDAYVLFSYSPQYAYYNEDAVGDKFTKSMGLLGEIFA